MVRAFIGLGSNLGDRVANIHKATSLLEGAKDVKVLRRASLYETEPVGVEDQPWFINTVVEVETHLSPYELLRLCKRIEEKVGRLESARSPLREIDLDILLFGDLVVEQADLKIPHAELHKRRFVLVPLCELDGSIMHPVLKKSANELLARLMDEKTVKRYGEGDFDRCTHADPSGGCFRGRALDGDPL